MNLCTFFFIHIQLFMWMGLPQVITSDQGTEFDNNWIKK